MIVVADTSPINYLILIGHIDLLTQVFGEILIPGAVAEELSRSKSPGRVREWIATPPSRIRIVTNVEVPVSLMHLDPGERESFALAASVYADRLLLDDGNARREAEKRGFVITGTLGILSMAADVGLVELSVAYDKLRATTFYAPRSLFDRLLSQHQKGRQNG